MERPTYAIVVKTFVCSSAPELELTYEEGETVNIHPPEQVISQICEDIPTKSRRN